MKKIVAVLALMLALTLNAKAGGNAYDFSIDLTRVNNDMLDVALVPPVLPQGEVVYRIPRIVPGTYEIYNFGRFIHDFKAFDASGKELEIRKLDENSWKMPNGKDVAKITYKVEDTYDTPDRKDFVFEPAGTNIEDGVNFMINTHGFFGYFDGMKKMPYRLSFTRPDGFYGATGISDIKYNGNVDTYTVGDYMQLVDSPIMYSKPDTANIDLGDAKVLVAVYSPGKKVSSKFLADNLREILNAQRAYLGGKLPIDKYAFLFYFYKGMSGSGASGALEHSYSSVYYLPEMKEDYLAQMVKDVAAHEFFHIVTPLNIHSEEIGDFDYNKPEMSEHLWLYEGITEYSAGHVQVKQGLMPVETYLDVIRSKMFGAERFNDTLPFTKMSRECLHKYKDEYGNVYEKGALIGLCLDIKLRHLSDGKYGVQELMRDLAKTYGKEKSFKDEELFDQIVKLTYPEIGEFFRRYVAGPEPLPLQETLALVGLQYSPKYTEKKTTMGGISLGFNEETNRVVIFDTSEMNEFGKKMGYKQGDEIVKFNGKELTKENADEVLGRFYENMKEGDKLKMTVERRNPEGKVKRVKLKGRVQAVIAEQKHAVALTPSPTEKQLATRKAWLGK